MASSPWIPLHNAHHEVEVLNLVDHLERLVLEDRPSWDTMRHLQDRMACARHAQRSRCAFLLLKRVKAAARCREDAGRLLLRAHDALVASMTLLEEEDIEALLTFYTFCGRGKAWRRVVTSEARNYARDVLRHAVVTREVLIWEAIGVHCGIECFARDVLRQAEDLAVSESHAAALEEFGAAVATREEGKAAAARVLEAIADAGALREDLLPFASSSAAREWFEEELRSVPKREHFKVCEKALSAPSLVPVVQQAIVRDPGLLKQVALAIERGHDSFLKDSLITDAAAKLLRGLLLERFRSTLDVRSVRRTVAAFAHATTSHDVTRLRSIAERLRLSDGLVVSDFDLWRKAMPPSRHAILPPSMTTKLPPLPTAEHTTSWVSVWLGEVHLVAPGCDVVATPAQAAVLVWLTEEGGLSLHECARRLDCKVPRLRSEVLQCTPLLRIRGEHVELEWPSKPTAFRFHGGSESETTSRKGTIAKPVVLRAQVLKKLKQDRVSTIQIMQEHTGASSSEMNQAISYLEDHEYLEKDEDRLVYVP
jgi:hypothetical protein